MRHSKPMKHTYLKNSDSLQLQNEKKILTIDGEKLAQEVSMNSEFNDIDKVYSSNYIRTISTAKYIADKNNLDIIIDEDLGERKIGITFALWHLSCSKLHNMLITLQTEQIT